AALPEILGDVEENADCLFGMPRVRNGKSKDRDDALSVSGMQVSTLFNEMRSGLANKFCSRFRKSGGLRIFRERKFVADVADHHAYCVLFWLGIERNRAVGKAAKFLSRETIGKKCSHQMRAVPAEESRPAFSDRECKYERQNGGNRLEEYSVKRADP